MFSFLLKKKRCSICKRAYLQGRKNRKEFLPTCDCHLRVKEIMRQKEMLQSLILEVKSK
jgi:hypothetical protein